MGMGNGVSGFLSHCIHPFLRHMGRHFIHCTADVAKDMLVIVQAGIVSAGGFTQLQFTDHLFISKVTQRVIHRAVGKVMSLLYQPVHHFCGSRMVMRITDDIINGLPL
ncbi:hypothetical protein D3C84_1009190 [compost metagenome]